jgi:hypothetical protein
MVGRLPDLLIWRGILKNKGGAETPTNFANTGNCVIKGIAFKI